MKVLVTGGAGFIGSNLVQKLLEDGHTVRILDNFSLGKWKNFGGLVGNFEVIEGGIEDANICERVCEGIDVISHQAAYGSVPRSIDKPELYSHVNLHGFVNMMNAARKAGIKRFVYASSSSVYGDLEYSPKVESLIGKPISPYAASKASNECFAHSFASCYGMTLIGLRYFNVYGPKQNIDGDYAAVIPKFVSSLLNNRSPNIYGDGGQSRDFTYIDNVVQANINSLFNDIDAGSHVLNIACGESTSVNKIFENVQHILKTNIRPIYKPSRNGDVRDSLASIELAKSLIHYNPAVQLPEGLQKTIEWYKRNTI